MSAYQQNFNQAVDTINQLVDNLLNDVELQLRLAPPSLIPEDYHPPQYTGSHENISSIQDEMDDYLVKSEVSTQKNTVYSIFLVRFIYYQIRSSHEFEKLIQLYSLIEFHAQIGSGFGCVFIAAAKI